MRKFEFRSLCLRINSGKESQVISCEVMTREKEVSPSTKDVSAVSDAFSRPMFFFVMGMSSSVGPEVEF